VSPPTDGWHWPEWSAELVGTALLMFAVVTTKDWAIRAGDPFDRVGVRVALVAGVVGVVVVALALSPLGRRSGAHLNPAVTLGLWAQGVVGRADLAGYAVAQLAGAVLGFAAGRVWGPTVAIEPVHWAAIEPRVPVELATGLEAAATFIQLALVFWMLGDARRARYAAPAAAAALTIGILALATTTGAAFNPVRGVAPDLLAHSYPGLAPLVVGPVLGGLLAGLALRGRRPVTGKLRHDPDVPCFVACDLQHTSPSPTPHPLGALT
jgi:glycerol uptake facilitator-like aquaporin